MKISVIIIAKNEAKTIKETIQATVVACENYFKKDEYEIIVVDSNSTDNTGCIGKEILEQKNILNYIYVNFESNYYSAALAREIGRKYACGQYILFLDGDMLLYKNFFNRIFNNKIFTNDVCGVVGLRYDAVYSELNKIKAIIKIDRKHKNQFTFYPGGGVLFKADDIQDVHYLIEQKMNEEELLTKTIHFGKGKRVKYVDEKMYLHLNYKKYDSGYKRRIKRAIESARSNYFGISYFINKYGLKGAWKYYQEYINRYLCIPAVLSISLIISVSVKLYILSLLIFLSIIIYGIKNKLRSFTILLFIKYVIKKVKIDVRWSIKEKLVNRTN